YRLAADQGHASAQFNLGVMYDNGRGVPQDDVQAVKWYRLAADQGFAKAQFNLGGMYAKGQGVTQDYVQAHKWFNLAAAQGDADSERNRDQVAKQMTPQQIERAQALARNWKPKQ
ncbi:MAG: tetratricopeptide repeat protein, partial [Holophagaceae bacterium]